MIKTSELNDHGVEIFRFNNVRDALRMGYETVEAIYLYHRRKDCFGKRIWRYKRDSRGLKNPINIACFLIIETERDFEEFNFELRKYLVSKKKLAFIIDMSEGKGLNSFEWDSEGGTSSRSKRKRCS